MGKTLNDKDREQWVMNDESLYNWWLATGKSVAAFVKDHRASIDAHIHKELRKDPT